MGDGTLEVGDEAVREALRRGVERTQERMQVLLRAAREVRLVGVGVRPVERAHVGVDLEQPPLALAVQRRGDQLVDMRVTSAAGTS